ncbi:serine/threonine protein phosphatase [Pseudoflavonifractor sp. 60]|uniref:serine/threonine protein phosphatase n=1 Tax=Pseudoflavonifractor sp. 60 TaxID=2304576 RepID=UPI00136C3B8C|nr:serine/threonine protein phosphatase [Pseudoflavonifractor sp. 60]NBI67752.1 serine/threonine protein phosphatase [Pseudoflavonifractor sp. 60]
MKWWKQKRREPPAPVVQVRQGAGNPFGMLDRYVPLHTGETALYRAIREGIPIVDAAIWKLTRLCGGVGVKCAGSEAQAGLERFFQTVDIGWGQRGVQAFLDRYLDDLFTCGHALGEIVLTRDGGDIAALLCADPEQVEVKIGDSPLDFRLCQAGLGEDRELPWQDLLLFTPFQPTADAPCGVSLLRSMPFLTGILLKIFQATGQNWERAGNLRFAMVYKPGEGEDTFAQERCNLLAQEWSAAMQAGREGSVRDFVAVGDVDIRVIGADSPVLDSQVPVRQILEQLVARTGIPPFMLGLSWSSTERMSAQQADMLTSEITAIRRAVEPALCRVAELWLRLHGYDQRAEIFWEDINLQDIVEEARAELYRAQTEKLRREIQ